jgi:hypothetical protein
MTSILKTLTATPRPFTQRHGMHPTLRSSNLYSSFVYITKVVFKDKAATAIGKFNRRAKQCDRTIPTFSITVHNGTRCVRQIPMVGSLGIIRPHCGLTPQLHLEAFLAL